MSLSMFDMVLPDSPNISLIFLLVKISSAICALLVGDNLLGSSNAPVKPPITSAAVAPNLLVKDAKSVLPFAKSITDCANSCEAQALF